MAAIDIAGFMAFLKDHAAEHGFHVHDDRHFVETYSLRQSFEVDVHPADACGGPLDLHMALEVDPRVTLAFEDRILELEDLADQRGDEDIEEPEDSYFLPLLFFWGLPPLADGPDLLVLATELAGVGGTELPLEVSATDTFAAVTDRPQRQLSIVGRVELSLVEVYDGRVKLCDVLDRARDVSGFLLERAEGWLADEA